MTRGRKIFVGNERFYQGEKPRCCLIFFVCGVCVGGQVSLGRGFSEETTALILYVHSLCSFYMLAWSANTCGMIL